MWQPGDDPMAHPLWEREVELEISMMRAGADRFRATVAKAQAKDQMTRVGPYRDLIKAWLPIMVEGIREWLRDVRSHVRRVGNAVQPVSYRRLKEIDPALAAYITLRHTLDAMSAGRAGLLDIGRTIGDALEQEAKMAAWEKRDPALFHKVQRGLKAQGATSDWKRRVNINRFNALVAEPMAWKPWATNEKLRLGLDLVDILVRYTKQFSAGPDPLDRRTSNHTPKIVLEAVPALVEWLAAKLDRAEVLSPIYTPTLIPPARWDGLKAGAYHTDYVRPPEMIRFKAHQENQRARAKDEYQAIDMPVVYQALHAVQEVPWRVNTRVLDVALALWKRGGGIAGLPSREMEPLPSAPEGVEESEDEVRARKRKRAAIRARAARQASQVLAVARVLDVATRYRDDTFYFPHMLDFRGRMYPIPQDLQPQGRDIARGLLTFAEGKPVGENGGWLAIHVANTYGFDKASFEDRIAWTEERLAVFERIAEDPIANTEWTLASDPFQHLAAVLEWIAYLDQGADYVSAVPIRVDGTCNGIQHLSALVRDEVGGAAVNLTPGEKPRDIYREVAEALGERLTSVASAGGEEGRRAEWWLRVCGEAIPRSLTKRPVMIMPYGGSRDAYFTYTWEWLEEERPEALKALLEEEEAGLVPRGERGRMVGMLCTHLWAIVTETVSGGVRTMKWLKECARKAALGNQPIYWRAPSGFMVRHFYGKMRIAKIRTRIDGQEFRINDYIPTDKLDVEAQLRGIAPNFVHSLDASALMAAIVLGRDNGITAFTAIHDAYGTVAADMWTLHAVLREAFVETHEAEVLADYRTARADVLAGHIIHIEKVPPDLAWAAFTRADGSLPPPLPLGTLDLEAVRAADYFFA